MSEQKLGIGLIPDSKSHRYISKSIKKVYDLNIIKKHKKNIYHMTLFQGNFKDLEKIINKFENLNFDKVLQEQEIKRVNIWIKEWLFLEFKKNKKLANIHNKIVDQLSPYHTGKAVDFLNEGMMTPGQRKSFKETGYQFSKKEFMPHITIGHLKEYNKYIKELTKDLNNKLKRPLYSRKIYFNRVVIYKIGENGACTNIISKKNL